MWEIVKIHSLSSHGSCEIKPTTPEDMNSDAQIKYLFLLLWNFLYGTRGTHGLSGTTCRGLGTCQVLFGESIDCQVLFRHKQWQLVGPVSARKRHCLHRANRFLPSLLFRVIVAACRAEVGKFVWVRKVSYWDVGPTEALLHRPELSSAVMK